MGFKHFSFRTTARIVFITVLAFGVCWFTAVAPFLPAALVFILALVYNIYALTAFVQKTNRDLVRFFEAIEYEDFSQSFSGKGLGSSFAELKQAFNNVLRKFQMTRNEKEEQFRYLQTIVQHIGIGLVTFQKDGSVDLVNAAAKRLLRNPHLKNIHALESFSPQLVEALFTLKPGSKALVEIRDEGEDLRYLLHATEFIMRETAFTLVSIQNIQRELEEKELDSWQRLIRILTHEIMNSITPISSLASTSSGLLGRLESACTLPDGSDRELLADLQAAVRTIEKRSTGLLEFVDAYRRLTRIPNPDFQIVPVKELCERVLMLMKKDFEDRGIGSALTVTPPSLEVTADAAMIEQVLINLLMNSMQAMTDQKAPCIEIQAQMDRRGRVAVSVIDNGCGILPDVQKNIFIPFYTTKQNGSGIGLSLSQQIMRLHHGSLAVQSKPLERTVFTLTF